jgi:pilus assembly protein CpaF
MALSFEILFPDGRRDRMSITEYGPVWIGRDDECHVVLDAPSVSRRHACLENSPRGLRISDHSANGTVVNDVLLHRNSRRLAPNSTVRVGPCEVRIRRDRPAVFQTPPVRQADASRDDKNDRQTESQSGDACVVNPEASDGGMIPVATRRKIHRLLLDHLELAKFDRDRLDDTETRKRVLAALGRIVSDFGDTLPEGKARERLVRDLCDEALGLGPLEGLLADNDVSEIMVVDPYTIYAERTGRIERTGLRFTDSESVRAVIERIVTPLGRRIDESAPMVDARLKDGSRVNAVIPPLAIKGPCITIRKFAQDTLGMDDLVRLDTLTPQMARFLRRSVEIRKNIVISGGTGSGKTTLLNILSASIPGSERIVTIEDAAELRLEQPHVVSLESRPANMEGKGGFSIRALLKNALRMRPDRIVVGECRGGEAIDMLQAMNTGHEGSMTTTHANSPREAVARLETLSLMAGLDLPVRAIRAQIAGSVHLLVQQSRFSDGSRRVTAIVEVVGVDEHGEIELREIFGFRRTGTGTDGKVIGEFGAHGYLPSFVDEFIAAGIVGDGEYL